jgi:hypothetical protein
MLVIFEDGGFPCATELWTMKEEGLVDLLSNFVSESDLTSKSSRLWELDSCFLLVLKIAMGRE